MNADAFFLNRGIFQSLDRRLEDAGFALVPLLWLHEVANKYRLVPTLP